MPSAFVDSNILIYAADQARPIPRKTVIAREVVRQRDLWISVQVLNEFTVNARESDKLGLTPKEEAEWQKRLLLFSISPLSLDTFVGALALHARYGVSHWDSLIIASARETDCATIYSEDLHHGHDYEGVQVRNPFL